MPNINVSYSKGEDIARVLYTIGRWDFYKQYYNTEWIKLPVNISKEKIGSYLEAEIIDSVENEYLDNSDKIYKKVEQEIFSGWNIVSDKIEKVSEETGIKFPNELDIQLTCYGMGGSYHLPNKIILLAVKFNLIATIVHELIHLSLEGWIQEYKIGQPQKERVVDLFMSKYFGDMFPERVVPKFSQQVYQKIDYQKIDDIFDKFAPDMETVVREVSKLTMYIMNNDN
jgi:hypothetical protein